MLKTVIYQTPETAANRLMNALINGNTVEHRPDCDSCGIFSQ